MKEKGEAPVMFRWSSREFDFFIIIDFSLSECMDFHFEFFVYKICSATLSAVIWDLFGGELPQKRRKESNIPDLK